MLKYHEREREKAFESWLANKKAAFRKYLLNRKKQIISISALLIFCIIAFLVVRNASYDQFIAFVKVTPVNLDRVSEDAFRKVIGYDYGEKVYAKDTAEIRSRLEASDVIFGDVQFSVKPVKLLPYKLEIKVREARPLFAFIPQANSRPVIYSDKGKIYPYSANITDLPIVEASKFSDIHLVTEFLNEMKRYDAPLYSRVSQVLPLEDKRQLIVFFNDVNFKTKFSLEKDYWETAFRHYRQLTRNMRVSNLNSVSVLDLRFRDLAYTTANGGSNEH
ncbi:MAG: hypothetical protein LBC85_11195 [Fibromonadaceae bacterium]|jgi:cell division septal protein FtsQ|nr:hypothetical protein [Fibromonadaceae bacterium]